LLTVTVNRTHSLAALVLKRLTGNTTRKEWNETDSVTEVIQYKRMFHRNGRIRMQSGIQTKAGMATLCSVALLLTTAIPSYSGAITDSFQSIAEQAWMEQYIPRSDEETLPLTDFDNFEVTELFRAETIEDLEASLTDGYPMPWLEEILKDTTIPWEDRYWLDCRVRGYIAENLHKFYNRDGSSRIIPCDWIRAGEDYWRETLIVNPIGAAPEVIEPGMPHAYRESGFIVNLFGEKIGTIAVADSMVRLSRDGRIGVFQSGWRNEYEPGAEMFVCFLYSDGSFVEIPIETPYRSRRARVNVSHDGNLVAFTASDYGQGERSGMTGPNEHGALSERFYENRLYLFNGDAQEIARYEIEGMLCPMTYPVISPDNRRVALSMYGGGYLGSQIIDVSSGEVLYRHDMAIRLPQFSQNSNTVSFSGQDTPVVMLHSYPVEILNEYDISLLADIQDSGCFGGTSISNNYRQLLCFSHSGFDIIQDGNQVVWVTLYAGGNGARFLNNGHTVDIIKGYNGGALSPNGYYAWLFETGFGQSSSHPLYGSKCLVVNLGEVE